MANPTPLTIAAIALATDPELLPDDPLQPQEVAEGSAEEKANAAALHLLGLANRFSVLPDSIGKALEVGLTTGEGAFHTFVCVPDELGFEQDVVLSAAQWVGQLPPPRDLVYLPNLQMPERPMALALPAGAGQTLVEKLADAQSQLEEALSERLSGQKMRSLERGLSRKLNLEAEGAISQLQKEANNRGFGVKTGQGVMQTFPILHGKPVSQEQFLALDEPTRKRLEAAEDALASEVEATAQLLRRFNDDLEEKRDEAVENAVKDAVGVAFEGLRNTYGDAASAGGFEGAQQEIAAFISQLGQKLEEEWRVLADQRAKGQWQPWFAANPLRLSPGPDGEAPLLVETDPRAERLFGYVRRRAAHGLLVSELEDLRAGSLHEAADGVLVVRAADVLADENVWKGLKHCLRRQQTNLHNPLLSHYGAQTLLPEAMPACCRVVMLGDDGLYSALLNNDDDFAQLFRVKVDVELTIERSDESVRALDGYLATVCKRRGWLMPEKAARARLLDLASRLAEDRTKLSLYTLPLEEALAFASDRSRLEGKQSVSLEALERAWQERRDRRSRHARQTREAIMRGEIVVESQGERVGVCNGLAVLAISDVEFGQPMRITAVVSLGHEGVIDVEREAHLGGAIHTKGVTILRGILANLFGQERPLSLRAQVAFEQNYGEIDGDSASSTELFAILSALSDAPIRQSIAVTGSVNQLGELQAIGGVCAKIESFFDICNERGLTGDQGVLMPAANLGHLVLRQDVAEAIGSGKFHIFACNHITEAIEVLTGIEAGERDDEGRFPSESIYGRVERRLIDLAERLRKAEAGPNGDSFGGDGPMASDVQSRGDWRS